MFDICSDILSKIKERKQLMVKEEQWYRENDDDVFDSDIVDTQIAIKELEEEINDLIIANLEEVSECEAEEIKNWIDGMEREGLL